MPRQLHCTSWFCRECSRVAAVLVPSPSFECIAYRLLPCVLCSGDYDPRIRPKAIQLAHDMCTLHLPPCAVPESLFLLTLTRCRMQQRPCVQHYRLQLTAHGVCVCVCMCLCMCRSVLVVRRATTGCTCLLALCLRACSCCRTDTDAVPPAAAPLRPALGLMLTAHGVCVRVCMCVCACACHVP